MRNNSAHLLPLLALLSSLGLLACSGSHGRDDHDGGRGGGDGSMRPIDGGRGVDAGDPPPPASCDEADDAAMIVCPELVCDGPPTWHWNGDSCFPIECGACEGADCASGASTREACMAAHASCESSMCRATGGQWLWWSGGCAHYQCGTPIDALCAESRAVCDCGAHRSFDPARGGCYDDDSCPIAEPISREELCAVTGGSWEAICCDAECGVPCGDACTALACNCGPGRVFEEARGCIESARCHERRAGETCNAPARCEAGTICCMHCGGPGCFGEPTCQAPVCDDDPDFDECGNNLLAP